MKAFLLIFFIVLNLILYHSVFTVFYSDVSHGCGTELILSSVLAVFETAFVLYFGGKILVIGAVIFIILMIIGKS